MAKRQRRRRRYKLGESFQCVRCGTSIPLDGVWLAAHWDERLRRACDKCGQRHIVEAGMVEAES